MDAIDDAMLQRLQIDYVPSSSANALPLQKLRHLADRHADTIRGADLSRGMPLQLLDGEGEPVLYALPFAIGKPTIPSTTELLTEFSVYRRIDAHPGGRE